MCWRSSPSPSPPSTPHPRLPPPDDPVKPTDKGHGFVFAPCLPAKTLISNCESRINTILASISCLSIDAKGTDAKETFANLRALINRVEAILNIMKGRKSIKGITFISPSDPGAYRWLTAKTTAINVIAEEIGRFLDWADEHEARAIVLAELKERWEMRRKELVLRISSEALSALHTGEF